MFETDSMTLNCDIYQQIIRLNEERKKKYSKRLFSGISSIRKYVVQSQANSEVPC